MPRIGTGVLVANAHGTGINWVDPTGGLADLGAHSYSPVEMLGNVGVACVVIAACCWLAGLAPRVTWPFAAAGSMTLTLYTAQVVAIAIAGADIVYQPSNLAWIVLCVVSLVFACRVALAGWSRAARAGVHHRVHRGGRR